ncbi:killer cell lectin-like receptor subfamily B member 1 isoform X5 [Equus asinus]|uniref:killer cell lectin-like receptor subfamily B member 1 isoform X5 n=1 Tax=Equus asinus TaxID=9793 RepID=UPI0038F78B97
MDRPVIYADLNLPRDSGLKSSSPPSPPQDIRQCPRWHQFALKLGCAGILLLALTVIVLSVSERPNLLNCPMDWHLIQEKCLFISQNPSPWNDSLADCSTKESILLLIRDQEELKLVQKLIEHGGILYWIGLNFTLPEKNWRWINGSFLKPDAFNRFWLCDKRGIKEHSINLCLDFSKTEILHTQRDGSCSRDRACPA